MGAFKLEESNAKEWIIKQLTKFPGITSKRLYKKCMYLGAVENELLCLQKNGIIMCVNKRWFLRNR